MRGEVWAAYPTICVQDDGDHLVTYLPPGAAFGFPTQGAFPAGEHPWKLAGHQAWSGHGMLALHWSTLEHAVFVFWSGPSRTLDSWYFNLQDAPRRTPIGFDTLDHELDLVWHPTPDSPTSPTPSSWQWKDAEKFAQTGDLRYPGRVPQIQAEGDRLATLLDAGTPWWDTSWAHWAPDPHWTVPTLPPNWQDLPFTTR
jgi:hypothetical protein